MENKSQASLEYLIMLALVVIVAALALVLTGRIFLISRSIKSTITSFRNKILGLT